MSEVANLLHGNEDGVYGDADNIGAEKRVPKKHGSNWFIAGKRSKVQATKDDELRDLREKIEHKNASVRARGEHPFRFIKRQFGHVKERFRGLVKRGAHATTSFASANLCVTRKSLLAATE